MEIAQDIFEKLDDYLIGWYFHNSDIIEKKFQDKILKTNPPEFKNELEKEMSSHIRELLYLKEKMILEEILKSYPKELTLQNIHFIRLLNKRNEEIRSIWGL